MKGWEESSTLPGAHNILKCCQINRLGLIDNIIDFLSCQWKIFIIKQLGNCQIKQARSSTADGSHEMFIGKELDGLDQIEK